jgi:N6-adenosine-specific RNA methylase IME4
MSVGDICSFPLPELAYEAHLFLWRVASMQEEALAVIRAWGFVPKAEMVWLKKTVNGNRHFGMGRQVRMEHEVCLIATRGTPLVKSNSIRSTFTTTDGVEIIDGSVFAARVGRHSEKPSVFYDIVEHLVDGPYCELFARRQRIGWTCLGDEMEGTNV